jgi:ubiquinone biosynthesis protein UbiJ
MMEEFLKLLAKKAEEQGGPKMNRHMEAKAAMAKELSDILGEDLADGLKKVTVASDSKEGLKKGLEKAEEVLEGKMGEECEDEMEDEESEDEMEDSSEMSDVEDEIAKLEAQIKELKSKKK